MTIREIKLTNDPAREIVTQLGGVKYVFDVRYNDRAGAWFMTISDFNSGLVLLASLELTLGHDLLRPYNLGIGQFIVLDEDGSGQDAGPDDLGVRVKLYWISPDEDLDA